MWLKLSTSIYPRLDFVHLLFIIFDFIADNVKSIVICVTHYPYSERTALILTFTIVLLTYSWKTCRRQHDCKSKANELLFYWQNSVKIQSIHTVGFFCSSNDSNCVYHLWR